MIRDLLKLGRWWPWVRRSRLAAAEARVGELVRLVREPFVEIEVVRTGCTGRWLRVELQNYVWEHYLLTHQFVSALERDPRACADDIVGAFSEAWDKAKDGAMLGIRRQVQRQLEDEVEC